MTDLLLGVITGILLAGFLLVLHNLREIRDKLGETNGHVERLADEVVEDDV